MIGFKLQKEFIDLFEDSALSIEGRNPVFSSDAIPGTRVFTFSAQKTKRNQRLLGFAEKLPIKSAVSFQDVEAHLFHTFWRKGELRLRDASPFRYSLTFHTDAGDIVGRIKGKKLSDLDLGTDLLNLSATDPNAIYPARNYALLTVKNPDLYGDTNPDFGGYVNGYENGAFLLNSTINRNAITPFPYLLYILERIARSLGYLGIKGAWTEEEDIRRLVIYNNYVLDRLEGNINTFNHNIDYKNHVPDMEIGRFLIALKNLFNLSFHFNTKTKYLEIEKALSILQAPTFQDLTPYISKNYTKTPYDYRGFALSMAQDQNDALSKEAEDLSDYQYLIDGGEETFQTEAGTLQMITEARPNVGGSWFIPYTRQRGSSPEFSLGNNTFSLRLLFNKGLTKDSNGATYPAGSTEGNYYRLGFTGYNGLYERCFKDWLNMLAVSEEVKTEIGFSVNHLQNIDLNKKILWKYIKYFIKDYELSISKNGLSPAKVTLLTIRV